MPASDRILVGDLRAQTIAENGQNHSQRKNSDKVGHSSSPLWDRVQSADAVHPDSPGSILTS